MNTGMLKAVAGWALSRLGGSAANDCAMHRLRESCHAALEHVPDEVMAPSCVPSARREPVRSQPPTVPAGSSFDYEDASVIQAAVLVRQERCGHEFFDGRCVFCGLNQ